MRVNKRLTVMLTLAMFVGSMLSILPAVAIPMGEIVLIVPTQVAPGGAILLEATTYEQIGGTTYFYLSLDDDPEISSGDIYFANEDYPWEEITATVFIPTNVPAEDYYVKASEIKGVGKPCVVTEDTIEVVTEDLPVIELSDTTGNVGDFPEISGEEAGDWDGVEIYWKDIVEGEGYDVAVDEDGEFLVNDEDAELEEWAIPNAFKDTHKVIFLFYNEDDELTMTLDFTVEPDITATKPAEYSIAAGELNQIVTIEGTGFPEGDIDDDAITLVLKNLMTGATLETYDTTHDGVEVGDADEAWEDGYFTLDLTVHSVEPGKIDVKIPVDGSTETFAGEFYSSEPEDDFTKIKVWAKDKSEGFNGDKVKFEFINLPSEATIWIDFVGETLTREVILGDPADVNGAYTYKYELDLLPGGEYRIRVYVDDGIIERELDMGAFTVKSKLEIVETDGDDPRSSIKVGQEAWFVGTGFPADGEVQKVYWGSKKVELEDPWPLEEFGEWDQTMIVPHISGGGLAVTVKVEGENSDGDAFSIETSIKVNPIIITYDMNEDDEEVSEGDETTEYNTGFLAPDEAWWDWTETEGLPLAFPGHPVRIVGFGFLAGEQVTAKLYDEDDDELGTASVDWGGKAASNGDLESVILVPAIKKLWPAGYDGEVYLKLTGSTSTNKADCSNFEIAPIDDDLGAFWFGVDDDWDFDHTKKVGDVVRVYGVGFEAKTIALEEADVYEHEFKEVTTVYGSFDTEITMIEMAGWIDDDVEPYLLSSPDVDQTDEFWILPKLTVAPKTGFTGDTVTLTGTGFHDDYDFIMNWVGFAGEEELDTVDAEDIDDGTFTIDVEIPEATAQAYKIEAWADTDEWDEAWTDTTFTIYDEAQQYQNKTLAEILEALGKLDLPGMKTQIQAALDASKAATTAATAAQQAAAAATAAAQAAGTTATQATAAANAAKAAADAAKAASDIAAGKSEAAKAAADAAKAAVDNANASLGNLNTLVYVAIGASLIAAIAAIVALMQMMRKLA